VHGVSPVSDPTVVTCKDNNVLVNSLLTDLEKYFEKTPVIVILPDNERERVIDHLKANKQRFA
jgi:hypothetical protein